MAIHKGNSILQVYKGSYKPINLYKGSTKIAGWKPQLVTAPGIQTGTYDDILTGSISGNTELRANWAGKEGLSTQIQTAQGKNLFDTVRFLKTHSPTYTVINDEYTFLVYVSMYNVGTTWINFAISTQYTFSAYVKVETGVTNFRLYMAFTDGTYLSSAITTSSDYTFLTVTSPSGKTLSSIRFNWTTNTNGSVTMKQAQVELGSTATTYEHFVPNSPSPAYPSSITPSVYAGNYKIACPTGGWWILNLTDDLRGIGDYKDKIELDLLIGKGKLRRNIHRRALTGNESWVVTSTANQVQTIRCSADIAPVEINLNNRYMITHFKNNTVSTVDEECSYVSNYFIALRINRSTLTTNDLAGFKAWVSAQYAAGNPVTVDYVLATETLTNLTLTHVDTSDLPELTLADLGITTPASVYPFSVVDSEGELYSSDGANKSSSITISAMSKVGSVADTLTYSGNGVWSKIRNIGEIASYAGETVAGEYVSSTGGLDTGAKVKYQLATPEVSELDLGELQTYPKQTTVSYSGGLSPDLNLSIKVQDII